MITSTRCRAIRARGLATAFSVTVVVLFPVAARAHGSGPVVAAIGPSAFTPPSPFTAQPSSPTAPTASTPSSPTPPAGMPTPDMTGYGPPSEGAGVQDISETTPLIPPNVEGAPQADASGGYCYVGPHPVDTRVVPGAPWDPTTGQHIRPYPPIDSRLFAYRDGCYYFTGDPRDFGYGGQTHAYYGAHPVLATYGGGWCFMMGGHAHLWSPWSPYFTLVGPWYYWRGAYDPFFWSYWPYYSHYYRSYYPHYYGGGRFYQGQGGFRAAPPIHRIPASVWRGTPPGHGPAGGRGFGRDFGAPITRGGPPLPTNGQGPAPSQPQPQPGAPPSFGRPSHGFGTPPAAAGVGSAESRAFNPGFGPSPTPVQRPTFSPPSRAFSPGPSPSFSPGSRPSFSPGPSPSFSPGPRPSFSPGPRPSFSPPAGGGFRGGGMGSRGRN